MYKSISGVSNAIQSRPKEPRVLMPQPHFYPVRCPFQLWWKDSLKPNRSFHQAVRLQCARTLIHHYAGAFISAGVVPRQKVTATLAAELSRYGKQLVPNKRGRSTAGQSRETNRLQLGLGTGSWAYVKGRKAQRSVPSGGMREQSGGLTSQIRSNLEMSQLHGHLFYYKMFIFLEHRQFITESLKGKLGFLFFFK